MKNRQLAFFLLFFLIILSACVDKNTPDFSGAKALDFARELQTFGARIPGSSASLQASSYIKDELSQYNWIVDFQNFTFQGTQLRNIIAKKSGSDPDILIGTHYDTRQISDQETDPTLRSLPVPGANDGTSGTAVLLELARVLEKEDKNIWLVLFDGEDQGDINGWDWSIGAQYFADNLDAYPQEVVIIDMIGDMDLNIYKEINSDPSLTNEIWEIAQSAGFDDDFIDQQKYSMLDDHLPFINLGIPSSLLIDFDYPYWHTQADTIDKISADSLSVIGHVLMTLLETR